MPLPGMPKPIHTSTPTEGLSASNTSPSAGPAYAPITNVNRFGTPIAKGTVVQAPTSDNAANTMIKQVGGMANWVKLFPLKTGKWTQVFIPQIKAVEGGQMPRSSKIMYTATDRLDVVGWTALNLYTGPKTDAGYAHIERKGPGGIRLFAWYIRDRDIARIWKGALKQVSPVSEAHAAAFAQSVTFAQQLAAAKQQPQGGKTTPASAVHTPNPGSFKVTQTESHKGGSVGARDVQAEAAAKKKKNVPALAWYEVTELLIKRIEKELPSKPAKAPIQLPKGPNFVAELLEGPKSKWPYAKVTASVNGTYYTAWFTIGLAGKNKPGSIVLLKRPKVTGTTPSLTTETLPPTATEGDGVVTGDLPVLNVDGDWTRPPGLTPADIMPIIEEPPLDPGYTPPGFIDPTLELGGDEEKPWWMNPVVIGLGLGAAGLGIWMWRRKK